MTSSRCIAGLLMVVLAAAALVTPPRIVAAPATVSAAGSPPCHSAISSVLVYALRGSVYRVMPDGRGRCRLTSDMNATEPQLAPGGRRIAFITGIESNGSRNRTDIMVRVLRVGDKSSSGFVVHSSRELYGRLAWSPNGRKLAFIGGNDLWVWNGTRQRARMLVAGTRNEPARTFAWSPDSRRLTVAFISPATHPANRLLLLIVDVATHERHTVTITFPAWTEGRRPYQQSYPSQIIAWLSAGKLLLGTSGIGIGLWLTGIWTASPRGGMAHLILGTRASPRVILRFPLLNTTQAVVSPDGKRILLDPLNRFWIAPVSARNGQVLDLHIHGSCAIAQVVWVGNAHLAYITVCTIGGSANILARLYTLPAHGGQPRLLATVRSPQQNTLSIAPSTRCIACGAG